MQVKSLVIRKFQTDWFIISLLEEVKTAIRLGINPSLVVGLAQVSLCHAGPVFLFNSFSPMFNMSRTIAKLQKL